MILELLEQRTEANARFFSDEAERLATLCHRMAERFARGGRLLAVGGTPQDRSDARHVAVEFVHPVIVGKRALPALALAPEGGDLCLQADLAVRAEDIVLAFGGTAVDRADRATPGARTTGGGEEVRGTTEVRAALEVARERGALTVAFSRLGAEHELLPPTDDPFVAQELVETLYHVLWELVHVFFEHRGLLEGRTVQRSHDVGESAFLYPFLGEEEHDLEGVLDDVRRSVLMKAEEVAELRTRTLHDGASALEAAATALRRAFEAGSRLLVFGNGGSATDAMDVVADFRAAPQGWPARPALDLTEDTSILTAVGNDVGMDKIFARQIIAYGEEGDVALGISTSGSSRNVVEGLAEARRRGLTTMALVGYDGGRIFGESLADHVIVSPSEHIPRIQEAQASAYHILRELVEEIRP